MTTIYGLKDPRDGVIRYVGRTEDKRNRLNGHVGGRGGVSRDLRAWIESLKSEKVRPEMVDLATCEPPDADRVETDWIRALRADGSPLLNKREFVPAAERRTYRLPVLLTTAEKRELRDAAAVEQGSQVSVGDYVRTAALEKAQRAKR